MSNAYHEALERFCVKTDPKAWAKRIMYRFEKGDTTVNLIQIQFASEALGIRKDKAEN